MRASSTPAFMLAGLSGLLLAACATAAPPSGSERLDPLPPRTGSCNADAVRSHVGKRLDPALEQRLRSESGATRTRVFTPERNMGTTDYLPDRLNVHIDGEGIVRSLACG